VKTHKLSVFAFGRGNYAYISPDREWQQTTGFFGKAALAHMLFTEALAKEGLKQFPGEIVRRDLARFEFFRRGERPAGVWLVRQGPLSFTLPLTTGTKQVYPSLVPFLELDNGRTLVAGDGADEIEPAADGKSLRAVWRRWAVVGTKSGQLEDPHVTSEVVWRIEGSTLTREETLKSSADVTFKRWRVAVPTTAARSEVLFDGGGRRDRLVSDAGTLEVSATADWPLAVSLQAAGGGALGRGARGGLPLHLVYEARDVSLRAGRPAHWRITLKAAR
jgi:hypothetical protein